MDKKVTLSILTYYDNKIKEWAVSLVDKSLESLGNVFTVKGIVSSTSDLPQELNTVGDVYLVGPTEDGGYAEYIWIETSKWEFIGTTTSTEVTGGVSEQELYAGSDNTGTPATPAEGTVLYAFDEALKAYIEATPIINDEQSSLETTYSSEKISSLLQTLKTEIEQANELEII